MSKVLLGDVAEERRETCRGNKDGYPTVGLEHLTPEEITLTSWDEGSDNTFTKMFRKGVRTKTWTKLRWRYPHV